MSDNKKLFPVGINNKLFSSLIEDKKTHIPSRKLEIDYKKQPLDSHVEMAKEKGLKLLFRSNSRVYGYFELQCGHKSFLHYGAIRKMRTSPKCEQCSLQSFSERAKKVGLTFLTRINTKEDTGIYSCNTCGNALILQHANVNLSTEDKYRCSYCYNIKLKSTLDSMGLKLLSASKNDLPEFLLPCGHTKRMHKGALSVWCKECQDVRLSSEALGSGIEYLKDIKPTKVDNKVYKLSCGCIKNLSPQRVKDGAFECKVHDKRIIDFSRNGYVYLIKLKLENTEVLKVGFTLDVSGKGCRYHRYGLPRDSVEVIKELMFVDGNIAYDTERTIHKKYKDSRLNPTELRKLMKNGFTECYPVSMVELLLKELEINV